MESVSARPATHTGAAKDAKTAPERVDAAEAQLASRLRLAVTRLHRRLRQHSAGAGG